MRWIFLFDYLEKRGKGLSEPKIKDIMVELNVVFKKMLSIPLIHRDIKPENLFIKYFLKMMKILQ